MIAITSYSELDDFVAAFGDGHINMLLICSRGGLGKSETVQRTLHADPVMISGHETPLDLYRKLHDGRDKLVVFDEIDGLLANVANVGLLKQVCETKPLKRVQWGSFDKRAAQIDGGVGYFYTHSRVCLLCNSFQVSNANVAALKSRGMAVQFLPGSEEILDKLMTFAQDAEIVEFLQHYHECIPEFILRTYRLLEDLKQAGLDWRKYAIAETDTPPKIKEIANLLRCFDSDIECVQHYSGSRRDFYNWKEKAVDYLHREDRRQDLMRLEENQDAA